MYIQRQSQPKISIYFQQSQNSQDALIEDNQEQYESEKPRLNRLNSIEKINNLLS